MILTRENPSGKTYQIMSSLTKKDETEIFLRKTHKSIVVPHNIEKIKQAWYDWTINDEYIQDAFAFLTNEEREFLITGLTPEEWKEIFKDLISLTLQTIEHDAYREKDEK